MANQSSHSAAMRGWVAAVMGQALVASPPLGELTVLLTRYSAPFADIETWL